ncbi:nucleotidyl transferase AbiEii/AbiGii toxin family protein [Candidatus Poribacteria bacterium]|nr:nucleotidyl transferase AbiEii/AbiGii toxin family protein [Candidatus Poribacteria bacterium]
MQDLIKHEQFELEVLDILNSGKFLANLVFCGGTMMRLCFGLDRYSVDLDFWISKKIDIDKLFKDLKKYLSQFYTLKDAYDKKYTILFELKSPKFPRSLKIEIRKEIKKIKTESAIAYSKNHNIQVFINVAALQEMMNAKIETFLQRKEIRDVYDIEFLLKKGIKLDAPKKILEELLKGIILLTKKDYTVKLGSLLEENIRKYYVNENFKILKLEIRGKLN